MWEDLILPYEFNTLKYDYPDRSDVFRCFSYFQPSQTKVVIIGQDPYHGKSQANGLAFAVEENCKRPPSLRTIDKELGHPAIIENWAKQGVLMLNASLTVLDSKPGCHLDFWREFTSEVIHLLNKETHTIVFVALGSFALNLLNQHLDLTKHMMVVRSHPSPLSAYRKLKMYPSFIGSNVFGEINYLLDSPIDW